MINWLLDAAIYFGMGLVEMHGKSVNLLVDRAEALLMMEKWRSAKRDCDRAIELDGKFFKAYQLRAKAYLGLGKAQEAQKDSNLAVELEKNKSSSVPVQAKQEPTAKPTVTTPEPSTTPQTSALSWVTPEMINRVSKDPEMFKAFQNPKLTKAISEVR